ncbi:MAG TPA: endonuclease/exonuclease/phosphatase family protein [Polyangiaceae bacterium]|jgi:endonuclease/exonuclease/phosphatase family metal-dependent hydrolase|nr:endonuclease/exonuclease/phosphatase family protein [Polyangiaceae bacterium]
MRVRVLTWNIHKGIGGVDRRYDLSRIIQLIAAQDADVALLQEVAFGMPRLRMDDQAPLLREALGFSHSAFGREHLFAVGGYGNLILSRFPLSDEHHLDLTVGWRKKRGAISARAHVMHEGHGRSLMLFNLHLGLAGSERAEQLERFIGSHPFAGLRQRTPIVLGGDLNDLWGSLGPRFLEPAGFARAGRLHNTFPAWFPVRPLDGLFFRGDVHCRHCAPGRSTLARAASDHLPLVADLELSSPSTP